jgi:hypothetical protein
MRAGEEHHGRMGLDLFDRCPVVRSGCAEKFNDFRLILGDHGVASGGKAYDRPWRPPASAIPGWPVVVQPEW